MPPAATTTPLSATPESRYQSSVAPHFPMKTTLTPRGNMATTTTTSHHSFLTSSNNFNNNKPSPIKTELAHHSTSGNMLQCSTTNLNGLLDANGSMAAAFAMSTAPGSSSSNNNNHGNAATVVCKVPKFLRSLYAILQTEDPGVISWVQNHELKPNRVTAFHILDMTRFERDVLPRYFKHQKFASFQRQLNNFGFRKWTKTQSSGVCTFSHNSFPPDPTTVAVVGPGADCGGGVLRATFREQWRQKSPLAGGMAIGLSASSMGGLVASPARRRVGNGITKADRRASRRAANLASSSASGMHHTESFMDLYKSPLSSMLLPNGGHHHHHHHQHQHQQQHQLYTQQLYAPSHQPATKKLAQQQQQQQHHLSGLEAFCDDTYKQFILPPLQPHHLLAAASGTTPRGGDNEPTTPNLGGFPHARAQSQAQSQSQCMDANSFTGAFLEPWSWDANMNSALELGGAFPLDFDWQQHDANAQQQQQQQHLHHVHQMHHVQQQLHHQQTHQTTQHVAVSVGVAPVQSQHHKDVSAFGSHHSQPQDRAASASSAEEFGLETFFFAE